MLQSDSSVFKSKIVLIGYAGDYLPVDSDYTFEYFTNSRITPMNDFFGYESLLPDMHDVMVSANIIMTLLNDELITEIPELVRIMIMMTLALAMVLFVTYIRAKYFLVTLFLYTIFFFLMMSIGSYLIVWFFDEYKIFVTFSELPFILAYCTVSTLFLNSRTIQREPATN